MTSKHCFFRWMKEDFSNKIWSLVLSVLFNTLAMPVMYLLYMEGRLRLEPQYFAREANRLSEFLRFNFLAAAGVVAAVGVLIVAVQGFGYLFHRDMMDTYESLPIKRKDRFLVSWLNGFLIWFVPFFINLLIMAGMGVTSYNKMKEQYSSLHIDISKVIWMQSGELFWACMKAGLVLVVCFLIIYNLLILAISLSGNILNALATGVIIGGGAIVVYLISLYMRSYYFSTWFTHTSDNTVSAIAFFSPIASVVLLMNKFAVASANGRTDMMAGILPNVILAIVLFLLSFFVFIKRPSELAQQGMRNKWICRIFQILIGAVAVFGGWIIMEEIAMSYSESSNTFVWALFGGILLGVLAIGALNVMFRMDFKAFFQHKGLMAGTILLSLLICISFYYDWFGYDTYLPKEDKVAEITILCPVYSSYYPYSITENMAVKLMNEAQPLTDRKTAYSLLRQSIDSVDENDAWDVYFYVRVELTNGTVYYRQYRILEKPELRQLVSEQAYTEMAYQIKETNIDRIGRIRLDRETATYINKSSMIRKVCEAYNRDISELGVEKAMSGRNLCTLEMYTEEYDDIVINIAVSEYMQNTIRVLREFGYDSYVEEIPTSEVEAIRLNCSAYGMDAEDSYFEIQNWFGVDLSQSTYLRDYTTEQLNEKLREWNLSFTYDDEENQLCETIQNASDIEEIMKIVNPAIFYGGLKNYIKVELLMKDGQIKRAYIPNGEIQEKYLVGFYALYDEVQKWLQ